AALEALREGGVLAGAGAMIEVDVVGDPVEPGREAGPPLEAGEAAVGPEEGLLGEIVGEGAIAGEAEEEPADLALMAADQLGEGPLVAAVTGEGDELGVLHLGEVAAAGRPRERP